MPIEQQIQEFAEAVERLGSNPEPKAPDLLAVLLSREALARALGQINIEAAQFYQLCMADDRLKKVFETDKIRASADEVGRWRSSIGADPLQWWWSLDEISLGANSKRAWFWTAIAGVFLTLSVGFMTEVASRFLKDGPDLYGGISIVIQALLAILSASAMTEGGRLRISRFFDDFRLPAIGQTALTVGVTATILLVALSLYLFLPLWARLYNDRGDAHRVAGSLLEATEAFKRAIALEPDYAQAHYNLAVAYEDLLQIDKSIAEYRTAVALDPDFVRAQNNLAHAILIEGKYPGIALGILDKLISRFGGSSSAVDEQYAAYKNRAWAKVVLNDNAAAEADVRKALSIRADGASANCLLAKITEPAATTEQAKAQNRSYWEACISHANEDSSVEAVWLLEARRKAQSK